MLKDKYGSKENEGNEQLLTYIIFFPTKRAGFLVTRISVPKFNVTSSEIILSEITDSCVTLQE